MEALQMVKFFLKKERLNFTKGWITLTAKMGVDVDDDDVLATIINNSLCRDDPGMHMSIDHVISVIGEEEADEEDG